MCLSITEIFWPLGDRSISGSLPKEEIVARNNCSAALCPLVGCSTVAGCVSPLALQLCQIEYRSSLRSVAS